MNLPAALEALDVNIGLSPALKNAITSVQEREGINGLFELQSSVLGMSRESSMLLSEITRTLDSEEQRDNAIRIELGSKWTRPKSSDLNASMRILQKKLQSNLDLALKADQTVSEKFEANRELLELVSMPMVPLILKPSLESNP